MKKLIYFAVSFPLIFSSPVGAVSQEDLTLSQSQMDLYKNVDYIKKGLRQYFKITFVAEEISVPQFRIDQAVETRRTVLESILGADLELLIKEVQQDPAEVPLFSEDFIKKAKEKRGETVGKATFATSRIAMALAMHISRLEYLEFNQLVYAILACYRAKKELRPAIDQLLLAIYAVTRKEIENRKANNFKVQVARDTWNHGAALFFIVGLLTFQGVRRGFKPGEIISRIKTKFGFGREQNPANNSSEFFNIVRAQNILHPNRKATVGEMLFYHPAGKVIAAATAAYTASAAINGYITYNLLKHKVNALDVLRLTQADLVCQARKTFNQIDEEFNEVFKGVHLNGRKKYPTAAPKLIRIRSLGLEVHHMANQYSRLKNVWSKQLKRKLADFPKSYFELEEFKDLFDCDQLSTDDLLNQIAKKEYEILVELQNEYLANPYEDHQNYDSDINSSTDMGRLVWKFNLDYKEWVLKYFPKVLDYSQFPLETNNDIPKFIPFNDEAEGGGL